MTTLGNRLKLARKNNNITQEAFAQHLNLTQSNISDYERDKSAPAINILSKMAKICRVDFEWLATGEGDMSPRKFGTDAANDFNTSVRLFKESATAILTTIEKNNLSYTPEQTAETITTLYKFAILEKKQTIKEMSYEQILELIRIFSAN